MQAYVNQIRAVGYSLIPQVFAPHVVKEALERVKLIERASLERVSGDVPPLASDSPIIWNLQNKHIDFLRLLFGPGLIERILIELLNDPWYRSIPSGRPNYILRSYNARSSVDSLALHLDSYVPLAGDTVIAMQIAIALEDMSLDNGCTLVVPHSHTSGQWADQAALSDAVPIEARAGDVVMWDSRIWHGASPNRSGRSRWVLIATFVRWWVKQFFNITKGLPQEIYEQLTPKQKAILGFCSIPHSDESDGIDPRGGYETLQSHVSAYQGAARE